MFCPVEARNFISFTNIINYCRYFVYLRSAVLIFTLTDSFASHFLPHCVLIPKLLRLGEANEALYITNYDHLFMII
jgi:hypothetical protein